MDPNVNGGENASLCIVLVLDTYCTVDLSVSCTTFVDVVYGLG